MGFRFLVFSFVILFSSVISAQSVPEDQIPVEVQNQIIADVLTEYGHLDMLALQGSYRDWILSQPLPDADGTLLDSGVCDPCLPPTDNEDPNFPPVRDVRIVSREGRAGTSFKVRWRRPVRLPSPLRDQYELDSYEIYLSRDDGTFESHVISRELQADGTYKLKRRIRFRRRPPGTYNVSVRPVYIQIQQAQAQTQEESGKHDIVTTVSKVNARGDNQILGGLEDPKKGPGSGGDPTDVTPGSNVEYAFDTEPNDELERCILDRLHFGIRAIPGGGIVQGYFDYDEMTLLEEIDWLDCSDPDTDENTPNQETIISIAQLDNFSNLRGLNLANNDVADLSSLDLLTDFQELNLTNNDNAQIADVDVLDALIELRLDDIDLSAAGGLPNPSAVDNLLTLSLVNTNLKSFSHSCSASPLAGSISFLDISGNALLDQHLSILASYPATTLIARNNNFSSFTNPCPGNPINLFSSLSNIDLSNNGATGEGGIGGGSFGNVLSADISNNVLGSMNLSGSNFSGLPDQLPEVCLELNLSGMENLSDWALSSTANVPTGRPYAFSLDESNALKCTDSENFRYWMSSRGTNLSAGCPLLGLAYSEIYGSACEPGDVAGLTVTRDDNNHAHYINWDELVLESDFRNFSYEIQTRPAGTSLPQGAPYVIDNPMGSAVIGNLAVDTAYEFRIRRCLDGSCPDYTNNWMGANYPLTNPVGVIVTWVDPIAGIYDLRWSYPQNYFIENAPHHFRIELPGQPPVILETYTDNQYESFWQRKSLQFTGPGILRISACDISDVCAAPATYMLSAEPVFDQTLEAPMGVSLIQSPGGDATRFSVNIEPNAFQHMQDGIDYFEISESGADAGENFTYFHDISDNRDAAEHSIPVRRLSTGHYSVDVRACRRNRLSPGGDSCSSMISVPAGEEHEIMSSDVAIGYDTVEDTLCWDEVVSGQEFELRWSYTPIDLPGQTFLIPDYYLVSNDFNPSIDPIAVPLMDVNRFTIDSSNANVGFDTGWSIQACDDGGACQGVGGTNLSDQTDQCTTPPPSAPQVLTPGGPQSLNPGVYLDESVFPRQGFTFFWASDLRHDNQHQDYGNTYDLYVYWQTYRYKGGNWTPIWLYGELKNNDPSNPNVFDGGLYLPQQDLTQTHDMEAGHLYITFSDDPQSVDTSTADIDLILHLDGGMHTEGQRIPAHLSLLSTIDSLLPPDDGAGNVSTPNRTDYNNGVWVRSEGGDDYRILSWQYNYFEGQILLGFDNRNANDPEPFDQPIWFNGILDCRDDTTGSCIGNGASITRHPDPNDATIQFRTVSQGVPPFGATQDEIDAVVSVEVGELTRTVPSNALEGTTPQGLTVNGMLDVTLIDGNQNSRSFDLTTGAQGHLLSKEASLHDIRYTVDGEENAATCTMTEGVCEIRLGWFSDDDFFNNSQASVFPYFARNGGTLQPVNNQLCNTGNPEVDFVVEDYVCQIRVPGEYRFYLRNRIGAAQQNTIAKSSVVLDVQGDANNTANPPLTTIFDSEAPFFPDRNNNDVFDPGFEAGSNETFVDLPSPNSTSESLGYTAGTFSVDNNGSANYTIPVMTVAGSGGFTPNVALTYNSQNGYGPMGKGWSVAGYSVISRCPQTFEQDGPTTAQNNLEYVPGVTFTSTDRFCLDGQRMMVTDGDYGADGSLYRLEIDSITTIRSKGTYGDGPACFEVFRPSGLREYYGDCRADVEDDSALIKLNLESGSSVPDTAYAWALASREDTSGNYITFEYQQSPPESEQISMYIDKVNYTGNRNNGQLPFASIEFDYEAKTSSEIRTRALPYPGETYDFGIIRAIRLESIDNKRLTNVVSRIGSQLLRDYDLDYEVRADGRKYLNKIIECGESPLDPGINVCYDPTSFIWSGGNNNIPAINLNGQSVVDLSVEVSNISNGLSATAADLNSDGYDDLLIYYRIDSPSGTTEFNRKVAYSNGDGSFSELTDASLLPVDTGSGPVQLFDLNADSFTRLEDGESRSTRLNNDLLVDANSDGIIDIVDVDGDNSVAISYGYRSGAQVLYSDPVIIPAVLDFVISDPSPVGGAPIRPPRLETVNDYRDINNDGIPEFIFLAIQENCEGICSPPPESPGSPMMNGDPGGGDNSVCIGNSQGCNAAETCIDNPTVCGATCPIEETCIVDAPQFVVGNLRIDSNGDFYIHVDELANASVLNSFYVDLNGDGTEEICHKSFWTSSTSAFTCVGSGLAGSISISGFSDIEDDSTWLFRDLNGDSIIDLFATDNNDRDDHWDVHYGVLTNGKISFSAPIESNLIAGRVKGAGEEEESDVRVFLDYTGDGQMDYIFIEYDGNDGFNVYASSADNLLNQTQREYLITDIYNGRGGSTTSIDGEHWHIDYRPMSDAEVYTRDNNSVFAQYGSGNTAVYDVINSMPLVSSVKHDMPAWRLQTDITSNLTYLGNWQDETRYHYRGLKMQAGGRGVLNFREVNIYDVDRRILTQNFYRQDFPFIGMMHESLRWLMDPAATDPWSINELITDNSEPCWVGGSGYCLPVVPADLPCLTNTGYVSNPAGCGTSSINARLLARNVNEYESIDSLIGNSSVKFSYAARQLNETYDLDGGALIGRTVTVHEYAETGTFYGNPTSTTVYTYQGTATDGAWLSKVTESRNFDSSISLIDLDNNKWITNRVDDRSMVFERPGKTARSYYYDYGYDNKGRLTSEVKTDLPASPTLTRNVSNQYDIFGNVTRITTSGTNVDDNRVSIFDYDGQGRYQDITKQRIDSSDLILQQAHNRNRYGQPLVISNQQGVTTYIAYDAMGKEYYRYMENGQWLSTTYNRGSCYSGSALQQTLSGPGPDQIICQDALGRVLKQDVVSLDGQLSSVVNLYDADAQLLAQSRPLFGAPSLSTHDHWTKTLFDELDRPYRTTVPDGGQSEVDYDGLTTSYTNAMGFERQETFNVLGEKVSYSDYTVASGTPVVNMTYDAKGNLTHVDGALAANDIIVQTYDAFDNLTSVDDPSRGGLWRYRHNVLGEQICQFDPNDQAISLDYDAFGRLVDRDFYTQASFSTCSGTASESHNWLYANSSGFGESGQLIDTSGAGETKAYEFDELGRLAEITSNLNGQTFHQRQRYDEHSRLLYDYDASGRGVSYGYNTQGYQTTTSDLGTLRTYQTTEALSPWGSVARMRYGNQTENQQITLRGYDELGRVASIHTSEPNDVNVVQALTYSYDLLGNMKTRQDDGTMGMPLHEEFFYDGLNRLTDIQLTFNGTNFDTLDISYDLAGRILSKDSKTYNYDDSSVVHGMTSLQDGGSTVYTAVYDFNGNQTTSGDRATTYTVFNKPSQIAGTNAIVEFEYGAGQSRYQRLDITADGSTVERQTLYVDNVEIITDNPGSGSPSISYKRYIGDTVIVTEMDTVSKVEYTHKDHLGSLNAVTDVNGNLMTQLSFGAFGERRSHLDWQMPEMGNPAESTTTRGYTGQEHIDSLNLIHMNARTYDASVGQMMQADSIIPDINNSQGLNRFAYVYNNPLSYKDPTGNMPSGFGENPFEQGQSFFDAEDIMFLNQSNDDQGSDFDTSTANEAQDGLLFGAFENSNSETRRFFGVPTNNDQPILDFIAGIGKGTIDGLSEASYYTSPFILIDPFSKYSSLDAICNGVSFLECNGPTQFFPNVRSSEEQFGRDVSPAVPFIFTKQPLTAFVKNQGKSRFPLGFKNSQQFDSAIDKFRNAAGVDDATIGVRGSAATGVSHDGIPFRSSSDIDFFIVSNNLFERAVSAGAPSSNGALRVSATIDYFPELHSVEQLVSRELSRKATVKVYSEDGFNQVRTGTEITR